MASVAMQNAWASASSRIAATFTLGYAAVRFGLELFRGDAARPLLVGLSEAQWFAVGSAVMVAAITHSLVAVIGVNYFCRLATTILAGPMGGSRGVNLGGVVVAAG